MVFISSFLIYFDFFFQLIHSYYYCLGYFLFYFISTNIWYWTIPAYFVSSFLIYCFIFPGHLWFQFYVISHFTLFYFQLIIDYTPSNSGQPSFDMILFNFNFISSFLYFILFFQLLLISILIVLFLPTQLILNLFYFFISLFYFSSSFNFTHLIISFCC